MKLTVNKAHIDLFGGTGRQLRPGDSVDVPDELVERALAKIHKGGAHVALFSYDPKRHGPLPKAKAPTTRSEVSAVDAAVIDATKKAKAAKAEPTSTEPEGGQSAAPETPKPDEPKVAEPIELEATGAPKPETPKAAEPETKGPKGPKSGK